MKKTNFYCDICGTDVEHDTKGHLRGALHTNEILRENIVLNDICPVCSRKVRAYLKSLLF